MKTKLKKLFLSSVDTVRAGANQEADICLFKSAGEVEELPIDDSTFLTYSDALAKSIMSIQGDESLDEAGKAEMIQKSFDQFNEAVEKFNPYHGDDGRFTSGGGGSAVGAASSGGKLNSKAAEIMAAAKQPWEKSGAALKISGLVDDMKVGDRVTCKNRKTGDVYEFERRGDKGTVGDFVNINGKNHSASTQQVKGWVQESVEGDYTPSFSEMGSTAKSAPDYDLIEEIESKKA